MLRNLYAFNDICSFGGSFETIEVSKHRRVIYAQKHKRPPPPRKGGMGVRIEKKPGLGVGVGSRKKPGVGVGSEKSRKKPDN